MIDRLKTYIAIKGLTEKALGEEVGSSQQMMNQYLSGKTRIPINIVMRILEVYPELSAEWLLRGEGEMKKAKGDKMIGNLQRMYEELLSDRDKRIRELEIKLAERNLKIG